MNTYGTEKELTGYPSIDKPWLKYYSEEAINTPLPKGTAYEYLFEKNKNALSDTALIYFKRKISYGKMFEYIDKAAEAFHTLGIKKNDIVALALPNIPENIYCIYGLNKLGAIADMIDLRSKGDTLLHYLKESEATVAVICTLFAENTFKILSQTNIKKLIVISPFDSLYAPLRVLMKSKADTLNMPNCAMDWKAFMKLSGKEASTAGGTNDVACIFHTSGTTGLPKGVVLTNDNFNAMTVEYRYSGMKFSKGDIFLNQVPPFLPYGSILATHLPLVLHMQLGLLPDYQPNEFAKNISKHKPNHVIASPADWNNILHNSKSLPRNLSFLKTMASGGDTMTIKNKLLINNLLQKKGACFKIMEGYGMTEIGSAACTNLPQCDVLGSVGIPLPLNTFCIWDNENEVELSYGKSGEICMRGPTVMKGYFKDSDNTCNVLKLHKDGKIWLHSGDLGHMDANGCIYIDGRIKRIIIRNDGFKISPFIIEKIIMKHPNVFDCCIVGVKDKEHGIGCVPIAYVVLCNSAFDSIEEIKTICNSELSPKYIPQDFIIIDKLPLTQNGKVDYHSLERIAESQYNGE